MSPDVTGFRVFDAGWEGYFAGTWLVLGEVVGVHIIETLIEDGVYQTTRAEPVMRGGGPSDYYGITEVNRFQVGRPE